MRESNDGGYQILSDGRRVWVNGLSGESLARLSQVGSHVLIDVHLPLHEQRCHGKECLDCRHDLKGWYAWGYFVGSVKKNYGVEVGEEHRPKWAAVLAKGSGVDMRVQIVEFVRAKSYRTEYAVITHFMNLGLSKDDAEYQLARCVEDGPLVWFGADEEKLGPDRAGDTPMRYRYAPNVSKEEKSMEIEAIAEINTLVSVLRRQRKKNKPVEQTVEALNKLGSRRPVKQRFTLSLKEGVLTLRAKTGEYLPESLQRIADHTVVGELQNEAAV